MTDTNLMILGKSEEVLKLIGNDSVDSVITSPEYGDLQDYTTEAPQMFRDNPGKYGEKSNQGASNRNTEEVILSPVQWDIHREIVKQLFRITKDNSNLFYNVCDPRYCNERGYRLYRISDMFCDLFESVGFRCVERIIWKNPNKMPCKQAREFLFNRFEYILHFRKAPGGLIRKIDTWPTEIHGNVWEIPTERVEGFSTPFPTELVSRLLSLGFGGVVLDPFNGSGQTCLQAHKQSYAIPKWKFIGIERNKHTFELSVRRLLREKSRFTVFNMMENKSYKSGDEYVQSIAQETGTK